MIRKILPFVLAPIVLYAINVLTFQQGLKYPLVPAFIAVIATFFFSGAIIGSTMAIVLSIYAVIFSPDIFSTLVVVISFALGIIPILLYEIRTRKIETADRIVSMMQEAHAISLSLLVNWGDWDDKERFYFTEKMHSKLADILTITRGWRLLAKERQKEEKEWESADNQ